MREELMEDQVVNKVGGRFKLASLIQKRIIALNAGARPLVNINTADKMEIALAEIMQDKIYLDSSGVMVVLDSSRDEGELEDDG
jgi:DNA-directed RNA polymerase subunit omega